MEVGVEEAGLGGADGCGRLLIVSPFGAFQGFKRLHKLGGRGGADSLYIIQLAGYLTLTATVAMVGDAEAVRFVAQRLYHLQTRRFLVQIQRQRVAGIVYLLKALGDAHQRHLAAYAHLVESLDGRAELPLASGNGSPSAIMRV